MQFSYTWNEINEKIISNQAKNEHFNGLSVLLYHCQFKTLLNINADGEVREILKIREVKKHKLMVNFCLPHLNQKLLRHYFVTHSTPHHFQAHEEESKQDMKKFMLTFKFDVFHT
ncbi:CLUMA_CG016030, isoform A [Clunio marinus]|uniref:CLUMA_CG016030, isoform A n=1 Tax=Clunio marinus TaxID=568069 RepID=A0A1J1IR65_9DIPT|nr:CLUMA_CG016030, isoform A [Clunio marinus]